MTAISEDEPRHALVVTAMWMAGAIASFGTMSVAGRVVLTELDTFELMFLRSLVGIAVVLSVAASVGTLHQVSAQKLRLHLLRNLFHFSGQNLWFFALALIPLAQLIALEFSSPVWVVLLAAPILGERITATRLGCALIGFVGVLIVAQPDPSALNPGIVAAVLAAIGFAGSAVFTRRLTRTESITCILFWLTVMQAVMAAVICLYDGHMTLPSRGLWLPMLVIGLAGLSAHFCLTRALSLSPAAIVMPMDFLRLPVMAGVGALLYSETLHPAVLLGAVLIILSNLLNLRAERARRGK